MATPTYTLIATQLVPAGSGSSSVTFSSIPNTYTDLIVKFSARVERGVTITPLWMRINSDTGTNYFMRLGYGNGSATDSLNYNLDYLILGYVDAASATSDTYSNGEIYIPNYAGSNQKSMSVDMVAENNATQGYDGFMAGRWNSTSAITSITFLEGNGPSNIRQYSNFYLYGIKNS
jgi:hypothetical protein